MKTYESLKAAGGNIQNDVFMKAISKQTHSGQTLAILQQYFVDGYSQATIGRHLSVSRQRVHTVCKAALPSINQVLERKK